MESHSTSLVFPPTTSFRSCSGPTTGTLPCPSPAVEGLQPVVWSNPWAESPSSPHCSVLPSASLGFTRPRPGVDAGFYKRMRSSQHKKTRTARSPPEFVFCRHWPAAGETQPGPLSGNGGGSPTSTCCRGGPQAPGPPLLLQ